MGLTTVTRNQDSFIYILEFIRKLYRAICAIWLCFYKNRNWSSRFKISQWHSIGMDEYACTTSVTLMTAEEI